MRYLITTHYWFMSSEGFDVEESDAVTLDDAKKEAAVKQIARDRQFQHARCEVIQIADNEHLAPRRLTWRERLMGRLSYPSPKETTDDE